MDHDALPWSNECLGSISYKSPNYTYELSLKEPTVNCIELQANETRMLSKPVDKERFLNQANEPKLGQDIFHIGWYPSVQFIRSEQSQEIKSDEPKFLNCSTLFAEYAVNFTFENNTRILRHLDLKPGKPLLPGSQLSFYTHFRPTLGYPPLRDLQSEYEFAQASAIRDAAIRALKGEASIG